MGRGQFDAGVNGLDAGYDETMGLYYGVIFYNRAINFQVILLATLHHMV